jgi:hypothetical protein
LKLAKRGRGTMHGGAGERCKAERGGGSLRGKAGGATGGGTGPSRAEGPCAAGGQSDLGRSGGEEPMHGRVGQIVGRGVAAARGMVKWLWLH